MFPGQGVHQQPQWQQSFGNGQYQGGPPPSKRAKNGAVVTRYPPPPGYSGPGLPHGPYQQPTWQQPQPSSGYNQQAYPGHPAHNYGGRPPYQQPHIPGYYAGSQHPSSGQTHQSYYSHPTHTYPTPAPPTWQAPNSAPQSGPQQPWPQHNNLNPARRDNPTPAPPTWQAPNSAPQSGPQQPWPQHNNLNLARQHNSSPFWGPWQASMGPLDGNGDPIPPELTKFSEEAAELENELIDECYYFRYPEEVEPSLSLGMIHHETARPTMRPLAATFALNELDAVAPRDSASIDGGTISEYFANPKRDEALLNIRQTDAWEQVRNDPIFREFSKVPSEVLTMSELLSKYKNRSDPDWMMQDASPTPEPEAKPTLAPLNDDTNGYTNGGAIKTESEASSDRRDLSDDLSEGNDVLGNLEEALQHNNNPSPVGHAGASFTSVHASGWQQQSRPMRPIRDQAQEDVLASLGVTGSPKMAYRNPLPAVAQRGPALQPYHSTTQSSRPNSAQINSIDPCARSPQTHKKLWARTNGGDISMRESDHQPDTQPLSRPPISEQRLLGDQSVTWVTESGQYMGDPMNAFFVNTRGASPGQHTTVGSDFDADDNEATPRPRSRAGGGLKRRRDDSDDSGSDDAMDECIE